MQLVQSPARYAPGEVVAARLVSAHAHARRHHGRTLDPASPARNGNRRESSLPLRRTVFFRARYLVHENKAHYLDSGVIQSECVGCAYIGVNRS
jgi:hypothetical protein